MPTRRACARSSSAPGTGRRPNVAGYGYMQRFPGFYGQAFAAIPFYDALQVAIAR
jgi:hypothetical protein